MAYAQGGDKRVCCLQQQICMGQMDWQSICPIQPSPLHSCAIFRPRNRLFRSGRGGGARGAGQADDLADLQRFGLDGSWRTAAHLSAHPADILEPPPGHAPPDVGGAMTPRSQPTSTPQAWGPNAEGAALAPPRVAPHSAVGCILLVSR